MAAVNRRAAARWLALRTGLFATTSLTALGLALTDATPARAQTIWTGANPGNWFSAPNWTLSLPDASIDARINSGAAEVGAPGAAAKNLFVGSNNTGALTIRNGGKLNTTSGTLGQIAGSSGSATVGGVGSSWSTSGTFTVGFSGTGTLLIQSGGAVSNFNGTIGQNAGSTGNVTVDGAGSTWTISNFLTIGNRGNGTLSIQNGGKANTNSDIAVGSVAGSTGTVTVNGAGSTWTNSGGLDVGFFGTGTLLVQSGATVSMGTISSVGRRAGSTGNVTVDGSGSTWTNSNSTYVGDSGNGTLRIQNGGKVIDYNGYVGRLAGSNGSATVDGNGSIWANSNDLIIGNGGNGTLTIQNGGKVSNVSGSLGSGASSTGTATVDGVGSTWTNSGDFYVGNFGNGTLTIRNGGTVSLAGPARIADQAGATGTLNIGAASGQAAAAPGTLTGSSVTFGAGTGKLVFNHTATDYVFAQSISGAGSVHVESGTTILTAANTYTGTTSLTGGTLRVNGSLVSAVTVGPGGTLGGSGTFGATTVAAGGVIAPGNSIGTLNSTGPVVLAPGAVYQVEVNAAGESDKIVTTSTATVTGATVAVTAAPGSYAPNQRYTILSAQGGVTGPFGSVTSNLSYDFLAPTLSYDLNNAYLTLTRNNVSFASTGRTPNQRATGAALDALGSGAAYNSVVTGGLAQAPFAFDALSGEIHASARSALIQDSTLVRDAVVGRLRQSYDMSPDALAPTAATGFAIDDETDRVDGAFTALGYAPHSAAPVTKAPRAPPVSSAIRWATWAQGVGNWSRFNGDGNAATMKAATGGIFAGFDATLDQSWRVGAAGGYTHDALSVSDRASSATINTYHLALYGGGRIGAWGLRFGAAHSWHDLDVNRTIAFGSFLDRTKAGYRAGTSQIFGDVGYRMKWGAVTAEPFAALAYVHLGTNDFAESGAAAALAGRSASTDMTFSSLGFRLTGVLAVTDTTALIARGTLGWRHAYSDITPTAQLAFAAAGADSSFTVAGLPVARDAALLEAGLDLAILRAVTLGVGYTGQLARAVDDHAVKGKLVWNF